MSRPSLILILLVLLGAFPSFAPLLAGHPRLQQAENDLVKATTDGISTDDQQKLLQDDAALLQAVLDANQDQDHLSAAVKYTNTAVMDLNLNESPDTVKEDITKALGELRAELTVLDGSTSSQVASNSRHPGAGDPSDFGTLKPPPNYAPQPGQPGASTATVTIVQLPVAQFKALVTIKGDSTSGLGFLVKTENGPVVVTNIQLISNNPNLKITTSTGSPITILSYKGASDREVAVIPIQDGPYTYLDLADDISTIAQPGDEVITPGNDKDGAVILNSLGKIRGIGPDRCEFSNPVAPGTNGGPVFHVKSGKVIGIVAADGKVDVSNGLDRASFADRNPAGAQPARYVGLRIDNVASWLPIDTHRLQVETAFLNQFDQRTRGLDCYLNAPAGNDQAKMVWQQDDKIVKANSSYFDQVQGYADASQKMDAARQLEADLNDIADLDLDAVQNPDNFYPFDLPRARDELAYRQALKAELARVGNSPSRLAAIPRVAN